jgi:hypothetical protein
LIGKLKKKKLGVLVSSQLFGLPLVTYKEFTNTGATTKGVL